MEADVVKPLVCVSIVTDAVDLLVSVSIVTNYVNMSACPYGNKW